MKRNYSVTAAALLGLLSLGSCNSMSGTGTLVVNISSPIFKSSSLQAVPDPDDFILTVVNSRGETVFEGRFGDSPDEFELSGGSYTVSAASIEFDAPAFDSPCFGDSKTVMVQSGGTIAVTLHCVQTNCGIRVDCDESFIRSFADCSLLFSGPDGSLSADLDEQTYAFFKPGSIAVSLDDGSDPQQLMSRSLNAAEMLTVNLSMSEGPDVGSGGGIALQIDSVRSYLSEDFRYGDSYGKDIDSAFSVMEARNHAGEKDVWVQGYIVGVATGSTKISFEPPFSKATNIVLGSKSSTADPRYCLSVELPSGDIREALNLSGNPQLKGSRVYIKGDLVSAYFGIPGLKSASEYQFCD